MATLSIEDFPDRLYARLQELAEQDHRSIAQEVIHLLEQVTDQAEPLSLLDLRGMGKECWAGVDPAEYVRQERDSWDLPGRP